MIFLSMEVVVWFSEKRNVSQIFLRSLEDVSNILIWKFGFSLKI